MSQLTPPSTTPAENVNLIYISHLHAKRESEEQHRRGLAPSYNYSNKVLSVRTVEDLPERKSLTTKPINPGKKEDLTQLKAGLNDLVILDTASGINITHDNSLLLHYKPFDTPLTNFCGVGSPDQQSPIKLVGEGYLFIKVSRKNVIGVHALYCPDEDSTILSVFKLHRDIGLIISPDLKQVTIGKGKIPTIKDGDILQVRGDLIIKGLKSHTGEKRVRVVNDSYKPKKISSYEAHLRLNHLAPSVIQKSVASYIFVDVDELSDQKGFRKSWRGICASGKATRQFHYTDSMNDYSAIKEPGESWSADTFGPLNKLPQGTNRYFLLMVDTVSRYLIVTTHKSRDEATISKQLLHNIAWIKTQFGRQFKELITDRGTEFKNKRMEEICSSQDIQHIFTPKQDHVVSGSKHGSRSFLTSWVINGI